MMRLRPDVLASAMRRALAPSGMSERHIGFVVDTLIATSLSGIDTHGVALTETYVRELREGRANPTPEITVSDPTRAAALLDADDALGVVAASEAIRIVIDRARAHGVSAIAVSRSNHCGALGHYTNFAAEHDVLCLAFSNSDALVAPVNGRTALNGTNPIAMTAPGREGDAFRLDMSTSQTSFLKALRAFSSIDPDAASKLPKGKLPEPLTPLGGHKGQGLGTMVQILCALLTGMPFDRAVANMYDAPYDRPREIGHLFVGIDIRSFVPVDSFRTRLSELMDTFRESPSIAPESPVAVPGDAEGRARVERSRDGIPVSPETWAFLRRFADVGAQRHELNDASGVASE